MKKRIDILNKTSIEANPGTANVSAPSQPFTSTKTRNPFLLNGRTINKNTTTISVIEGGPGRVKVLIKGAKK